jgi:hypothetical protein
MAKIPLKTSTFQTLHETFAHSSPLDAVSDAVTLEEWTGKMKSWKETTSTSPSGMHLGHHKTLIKPFLPDNPPPETPPELLELESQRQDIAQAQVDLLNLAIKNQYTYERTRNPEMSKVESYSFV